MNFTMPIFSAALPEIFVLSMISLIIVVDLFLSARFRIVTYVLAQWTLFIAFILTLAQYREYSSPIVTFSGLLLTPPINPI